MREPNLYNAIVFSKNWEPRKYRKIDNVYKFSQFLDKEMPDWSSINVYFRPDSSFVKQYRKGSFIDQYPR